MIESLGILLSKQIQDNLDKKKKLREEQEICSPSQALEDSPEAIKEIIIPELEGKISALPSHTQKSHFFVFCYKMCANPLFQILITVLIIANTFILALDRVDQPKDEQKLLEILNNVFMWCFFFEMILKLLGLGFKEYARDSFNLFDAILVVVSLIEYCLTMAGLDQLTGGALSSLRGVRLLRVFKLARSWKSFRELLMKMFLTLKDVRTFSVLLSIFIFIFMLLGMELFGHKIKFNSNGEPINSVTRINKSTEANKSGNYHNLPDGEGVSPRANFDTWYNGFITIFIVFVGDDWNSIMYDHYRNLYEQGQQIEAKITVGYFIALFIIGNFILLNLFLAILLSNFEDKNRSDDKVLEDQEEEEQNGKSYAKILICLFKVRIFCSRSLPCCIKPPSLEEESESDFSDDEKSDISRKSLNSLEIKVKKAEDLVEKEHDKANIIPEKDQALDKEKLYSFGKNKGKSLTLDSRNKASLKSADNDKRPSLASGWINKLKSDIVDIEIQNEISRQKNHPDESSSSQPSQKDLFPNQNASEESEELFGRNFAAVSDKESSTKNFNTMQPKLKRTKTIVVSDKAQQIMSSQELIDIKQRNTIEILKRRFARQMKKERKEKARELLGLRQAEGTTQSDLKRRELVVGDTQKNIVHQIDLEGRSLCIFGSQNQLRQFCKKVVEHPLFDNIVLTLILISTVLLTLDSPLSDPKSTRVFVLDIMDSIMTMLFTLELIIKVIVLGFACNGSASYTRNGWNIMDGLIVILSIFKFLPINAELGFIKVMRLLRVVRPLRLLTKYQGMRVAVESLIKSIPGFGNVMVISVLMVLLFGILGTTFYKGLFYNCHMEKVPLHAQGKIKTMWSCMDYGGEWIQTPANFDNVKNAMLTLFTAITTEGWVGVMWEAVDSTEPFVVPKTNNSVFQVIFFLIYIVAGALFIVNLFVGVVISNFNLEKEKIMRDNLLTPLQMEFCDTMVKCYKVKAGGVYVSKGNKCKDALYYTAISKKFENFIFGCICFNTICMAATWYQQPKDYTQVMEYVNYIFGIIYTIECIIKISVFGKLYFKDGWNNFDFIIVASAWIGFFLEVVFKLKIVDVITILRSFRILRVFKMVKRSRQLRKIFNTFVVSIPNLGNVGSLLFLLLLLYAVLGVFFFAKVELQDNLNAHANFQYFGLALLTLLRMTTGEAWNEIMWDAARERSILFQCKNKEQSYEEIQIDGIKGCGNSFIATIYFVSFIMIGAYVFLNMFIAIILQGFASSEQEEKMRVKDETIQRFIEAWMIFDPRGTGMIQVDLLEQLIIDLTLDEYKRKPKVEQDGKGKIILFNLHKHTKLMTYVKFKKGLEKSSETMKAIRHNARIQKQVVRAFQTFIAELDIPSYNHMKNYNFHDTLIALVQYLFRQIHSEAFLEREERIEDQKQAGVWLSKWDKMKDNSSSFKKLNIIDQERFLELTEIKFQRVINRMEKKGYEEEKPIQRLKYMKELRIKQGMPFKDQLDQTDFFSISSGQIMGARTIVRYIRLWQEKRRLRIEKEKARIRDSQRSDLIELDLACAFRPDEVLIKAVINTEYSDLVKQVETEQFEQLEQQLDEKSLEMHLAVDDSKPQNSLQFQTTQQQRLHIDDYNTIVDIPNNTDGNYQTTEDIIRTEEAHQLSLEESSSLENSINIHEAQRKIPQVQKIQKQRTDVFVNKFFNDGLQSSEFEQQYNFKNDNDQQDAMAIFEEKDIVIDQNSKGHQKWQQDKRDSQIQGAEYVMNLTEESVEARDVPNLGLPNSRLSESGIIQVKQLSVNNPKLKSTYATSHVLSGRHQNIQPDFIDPAHQEHASERQRQLQSIGASNESSDKKTHESKEYQLQESPKTSNTIKHKPADQQDINRVIGEVESRELTKSNEISSVSAYGMKELQTSIMPNKFESIIPKGTKPQTDSSVGSGFTNSVKSLNSAVDQFEMADAHGGQRAHNDIQDLTPKRSSPNMTRRPIHEPKFKPQSKSTPKYGRSPKSSSREGTGRSSQNLKPDWQQTAFLLQSLPNRLDNNNRSKTSAGFYKGKNRISNSKKKHKQILQMYTPGFNFQNDYHTKNVSPKTDLFKSNQPEPRVSANHQQTINDTIVSLNNKEKYSMMIVPRVQQKLQVVNMKKGFKVTDSYFRPHKMNSDSKAALSVLSRYSSSVERQRKETEYESKIKTDNVIRSLSNLGANILHKQPLSAVQIQQALRRENQTQIKAQPYIRKINETRRWSVEERQINHAKQNNSDQKATTHFGIIPRNKWLSKNGKPITVGQHTSMERSFSPGSMK